MPDLDAQLEKRFAQLEKALHARIGAIETNTHRKLDALVIVAHHLLTRGQIAMDHAELLKLAQDMDTKVEGMVDDAITAFQKIEADHAATVTTTKEALDDVGAILSGIPDKVAAKLAAIKPADSTTPAAAAPTIVPVAAPVAINATVIPVTTDTPVVVGSGIASAGIMPGATVIDSDTTSLTLSAPTIDTHAPGDTLTVTPPAAG